MYSVLLPSELEVRFQPTATGTPEATVLFVPGHIPVGVRVVSYTELVDSKEIYPRVSYTGPRCYNIFEMFGPMDIPSGRCRQLS